MQQSFMTDQQTQESLVHWYKSHHLVHGNNRVTQTEESENEYIVEDKRYLNTLCSFLWNPFVMCYYKVKRIRAYRHFVQNVFEETFRAIRWVDLPGGQDQIAIDRNYMLNYVWLMAFITNDIDTANKDSARHIRYRFEDVLFHAESLGMVLQRFFEPLQDIAQSQAMVEEVGEFVNLKIPQSHIERKIFRLSLKPDYTILPGNNIKDFSKVLAYVRRDTQIWSRFRSLSEADKVDIVTKGLSEISDNLKELKGLLKRPLNALHAANRTILHVALLREFTLVPHVKDLRNSVRKIMEGNYEEDDKEIVSALLSEVADHYSYILRYGELLVEEVWDIILMVRLSYNFIKESKQNNIMVASRDAVMISKFARRKLGKLLGPSSYAMQEFYQAECPDTLRKLPIVILSRNTEICLHLQGHANLKKSATTAGPTKRFTMKRMMSAFSDKLDDKPTTTQEKKGLLFVSGGD